MTANPSYPVSNGRLNAEESTVPPVAIGLDAFELVGLMHVAEGRISETRFRKAMEVVKKAVARE